MRHGEWMQSRRKKFWLRNELFARSPPSALFQPWPRFQPFGSKFHRDSDFKTPVTVLILQFQRYVVASGLATVRGVEQPE